MKDKKLAKLIAYLLRTHEDCTEYMEEFYEQCKNKEVDDLEWLQSDDEMDDFLASQPIEYNRIYDYAAKELSARLLKILDIEI